MQLCHYIIHNDLGDYKVTVIEEIDTINHRIKQNKTQYDLDRQKVKISDLSSENVGKYEFLFYQKKDY